MPVFQPRNPTPFTIPVRILGSGFGFPKVVMTPGPGGPIPIPYPDPTMRLQVRMPNGQWSPEMKLNWKPGEISLPKLW